MSDGFRCRDRRPDTGRELGQGARRPCGKDLPSLPTWRSGNPFLGYSVTCPPASLTGPSINVGMRAASRGMAQQPPVPSLS